MDPQRVSPEELAKFFHDTYERLAPAFSYETRRETAVPWDEVMKANKQLMVATATAVLLHFFPERMAVGLAGVGLVGDGGKEGVAELG
jgi:hypothetical protein